MTSVDAKDPVSCKGEEIAAYLDGELSEASRTEFELHVKECAACAEQLREQKRLLCALDFALGDERSHPLPPANFARVVAAHAQSDMRGVRASSEHKLALWLCAALALASAFMIGGAGAGESVIVPVQAVTKPLATLAGFFWHTLYNAGTGLVVISRVSAHLLFESRTFGLVGSLLLISALGLLPRLIISYHRRSSSARST